MTYHSRRGVSLIEMMIAMVISLGLGAAMVSLLSSSTHMEERDESQRAARLVARSAVNVLVNDLRMIDPAWGIDSATTVSLRVKSPYAIGMVCDSGGAPSGPLHITVLPVDSVNFATAGYSGVAWRSTAGSYTAISGGTLTTVASAPASCATNGVQSISAPLSAPNQKTLNVTITGTTHPGVKPGMVVLLYRRVNFYFANSAIAGLTTRRALWRNYLDGGAGATELVSPFDTTAAFNFYVSGSSAASSTPPATLLHVARFPALPAGPEREYTTRAFFAGDG